jgi:4-hydroxybenzoate polyprenyltransferase
MLHKLARITDWWQYKIPPLLSIAYAVCMIIRIPFQVAIPLIVAIIMSLSCVAIFGYLINDIYDVEGDQRLGRTSEIVAQPVLNRIVLLSSFFVGGFIPLIFLGLNRGAFITLFMVYLLPALYSMPPFRLKERGILGIFVDSLGMHTMPTVFVGLSILGNDFQSDFSGLWLSLATCWAFSFGLRGIVIHQIQDREQDRVAGFDTFVMSADLHRTRRLFTRVLFPVELLLFIILLVLLAKNNLFLWPIFVFYSLVEVARSRVTPASKWDVLPEQRGTYIVLTDLYEVWFPLGLLAGLISIETSYLFLLVLHLILFYERINIHVEDLFMGMRKVFD